jgi:hypothetical protein
LKAFWRRRTPALPAPVGVGPLAAVTRYYVIGTVLDESLGALADAGADSDELFVAWGARVRGDLATMTSAIVPAQRCLHTPHGLLVHIEGDALFELNKTIYQQGEVLAGQAHGHPTTAYHSPADDELAIVTTPGGISLVVPDFARGGRGASARWQWFRLDEHGRWSRLTSDAVEIV